MSIDIIVMEDCASNYGVYEVRGSKGDKYTVTLSGSEGPADCTCNGFRYRKECKHVDRVYKEACLYNPQWHDSNDSPLIRPVEYTYTAFSSSKCACGGPMVYVKRAV